MNRGIFLRVALCVGLLVFLAACEKKVAARDNADTGTGPVSSPVEADSASRSAYGMMITTWLMTSPANEPLSPVTVKKRRNAMPSTAGGTISGACIKVATASRPGKR